MEVSTFPTLTKGGGHWFSPSPACASESSLLLLSKRKFPKSYQFSLSISPIKREISLGGVSTTPTRIKNQFKVFSIRKEEEPAVLEARCIDEIYDALAARLIPTAAMESNLDAKCIVGLAGPPGAGKSTVASEVVRRINMLWPQKAAPAMDTVDPPDYAIVLPMDGFHLYRHQLDAMQNPEEAHARRGAPWTFDPVQLLECLQTLRSQGSVYAPSFDHGVGDPVEDDIFVSLQHKLVIVEGNYLLLEDGPWKEVSSMFDEKWFIEVDTDTAMQRVLKRHISTGKPPDVANWRIEYNDRPNAELINKSKKNADLIIRLSKSVDSTVDELILAIRCPWSQPTASVSSCWNTPSKSSPPLIY